MTVANGLGDADFALSIDGKEVRQASANAWKEGIILRPEAPLRQTEKLRAAIVKKGKLFYRRWRPFNDHERHWGFIGGDFKLYDAEVAEVEAEIARLRRPQPLHCALVRQKGAGAQPPGPLKLKDGDCVVLLGGALIEHEQFHGYLETRLTQCFPDATVRFRNLGWGGDTVHGEARTGGFQKLAGFERLLKEVRDQKPTVIFLAYGGNESFDGPEGLPGFLEGYRHLLDQLAPLKARIVILSPTPHEDLGRPFPEPAEHNRNLERYTAALSRLADERKHLFVDLFRPLQHFHKANPQQRLTENGLLPNELGYWLLAREVELQLVGREYSWQIELRFRAGWMQSQQHVRVENVTKAENELRFELVPEQLPAPAGPAGVSGEMLELLVWDTGGDGDYSFAMGGKIVREASARAWIDGLPVKPEVALWQTEKLRTAVVKKTKLFYRRWRPFNDFEEHWGYIGGDFKLYDAQIAEAEAEIARLRRPQPLRCEFVRKARAK
jgi:lysophospholipase L1-like esterase